MHLNSKLLIQKYGLPYFKKGSKVLEIGPDKFPSTVQEMMGQKVEWHTLNIFNDERLTFPKSDEYSFPIQDNTYDIVISANVIEHVRKPWIWLPELVRVTKPGGTVITVNPVSWVYHEDPVDCWRIYPEGMKSLYEDSKLSIDVCLYENLETEYLLNKRYNSSKFWPGITMDNLNWFKKLKIFIGYPVMAALDTITIGKKVVS